MRLVAILVAGSLACATASSRPTNPVLRRQPGTVAYRLTVHSDEGGRPRRASADFRIVVNAQGEAIELLSLCIDGECQVDEACRSAFGGGGEIVGRFRMVSDDSGLKQIPRCLSEAQLGLVTDAISFTSIQTPRFGIDKVSRLGDEASFDGFEVAWHEEPPDTLIEGRIWSSGGTLAFSGVEPGLARLSWRPRTWDIGMVRNQGGQRLLIGGKETFELEISVDASDGWLRSGRSLRDELNLQVWPYQGTSVPPPTSWPQQPGAPVKIHRRLTLERI
jgi:hypothetical protein